MIFDIVTLFPGMFQGPLTESILKRAAERGLITVRLHNIRDYATDKHRTTDDAPYGGGAGMVMKVEPIVSCVEAVGADSPAARVLLTTPRGRHLTQEWAASLAREERLVLICGRYEGVDERVRELCHAEEVSLGDFVLTGGEIPAMAVVDAVARLVRGVLGSEESAAADSFSDGLLEYPHYTRPPEFRGACVPEVLLSGNHREIAHWRRHESLRRTWRERPELLERVQLTGDERKFLRRLAEEDR